MLPLQHMDKIYGGSNPGIFRFHYALPSLVCRSGARYWIFQRIRGHRTAVMGRRGVLLHPFARPHHMFGTRLCLEIVRVEVCNS